MLDTTVKFFQSGMSGYPALSGQAGSLIGVLDACLQDGFGTVTLTTPKLVVASNVATATVSGGHGFPMVGQTGMVIRIAGSEVTGDVPGALNADWRIASVPTSTTFTFATSGVTDQTATGTITAKRAPAGFTKVAGTNKASYRSDDLGGNRLYWRVEDSTAKYATSAGYETMSDIDTGTTFATGLYITKSYSADATERAWTLASDGRMVYLFVLDRTDYYYEPHFFGDFIAFVTDAYSALLAGATANTSSVNSSNLLRVITSTTGKTIARSYSGAAGGIAGAMAASACATYLGRAASAAETSPSPVSGQIHLDNVSLYQGLQSTGVLRGTMPGLYSPRYVVTGGGAPALHETSAATCWLVSIGNPNADTGAGAVAVDLTGPWR